MKDNNTNISNQLEYLEALIEVLPRENYIKLYDIICDSEDADETKEKIMEFFEFTESQAQVVYEMKLKAFSLEESSQLKKEYRELKKIQKALDKYIDLGDSVMETDKEWESYDFLEAEREFHEDTKDLYEKERVAYQKRKNSCALENMDSEFSGVYEDENVLNITNSAKGLIGSHVKYAAVGGKIVRNPMRDSLVEETKNGFVLNPDWEGSVYILFDNGAEIEISGSDYVSVIIRNDHM